MNPITGHANGVPFLAIPPADDARRSAPVVLAWHLMDPPRTPEAFAAAVPLTGLDAWRIYLGLPLSGSRLPEGGFEALMRLGFDDAVLNLQRPVVYGAAEELPGALTALREQLGIDADAVGVMGGSSGAAVAQLVMAEGMVEVRAAVLVSPVVQLRPVVEAMARQYEMDYSWSPESDAVAERLDFVARAREIADRGTPAVLLVVGQDDDPAFHEPAAALRDALRGAKAEAEVATVPGMGHALADEPGMDPAPQTAEAAAVDRLAVSWFRRHLTA